MAPDARTAARPRSRADHVGCLPRSEVVGQARATAGLSPEALAEVEDAAIARAAAMRQDIGLPVGADGEFRRAFRHYDVMGALTRLDLVERAEGVALHGAELKPIHPIVTDRIAFTQDHPMLGDFRYPASVARVTPKMSIPGPRCIHFRVARADLAPPEHRDEDVLFADPGRTCRRTLRRDAETIDAAIVGRPADMTIAMQMRRVNFKSTVVASGGYDPAAEAIFSTDVDVYFMEHDSERAGGFEPLRPPRKGDKRMTPGLVTTKTATLETLDDLKRAFDAASRFADLGEPGLAPQCGFPSTEGGDLIAEDEQKRKLDLVARAAEAIWGAVDA